MAKTLTIRTAGPLQLSCLSDRCKQSDTPIQRAAKRKASSEAQRRMNQIYSYQKLEMLLACNFPTAGSALVIGLTYDDRHLPKYGNPTKDRKKVQSDLRSFLKRVRKARAEAGLPDVVAFWCIEVLTSKEGRWHVHLVLNNTGSDYDKIRRAWIYGHDIDIKPLRTDSEKNWETLARYMSKEARECQDEESRAGLNAWSHTRNILKPEVETVIVPDDYEIQPPEGATVLLDEKRRTEFSSWHVIKVRYDGAQIGHESPRPKRRKRQRR